VSTLQAINAAHTDVQQAAQLWTPATWTTAGNTASIYCAATPAVQPVTEERPRRLSSLEWLDEQIGEVTALAVP
jgi:hypothetical protein